MRPRHATESDKSPLLPPFTPLAAPLSSPYPHHLADFHPCVAALAFPAGDDPPHSCQSHSTVIAPVSRTRGTRTSRNPYLHPPSNATRTRCPTPRPPIIEPFTLPHSLTATRAKFSGSEERGDSRFKPIKTMIKAPIVSVWNMFPRVECGFDPGWRNKEISKRRCFFPPFFFFKRSI